MNSLIELEKLGVKFQITEIDSYGFQDLIINVPKDMLEKVV